MKIELDIDDAVVDDHLEPFYKKNRKKGEAMSAFIVRAVISQAINAKAEEDCQAVKAAMERDLGERTRQRMTDAQETAKVIFGS